MYVATAAAKPLNCIIVQQKPIQHCKATFLQLKNKLKNEKRQKLNETKYILFIYLNCYKEKLNKKRESSGGREALTALNSLIECNPQRGRKRK